MRIVFMGTPPFAAAVLERLLAHNLNVVAVWCRPDRPAGRGKKLSAPAVKLAALAHGLPVHQPENFKTPEAVAELAALEPDVLAVAAYGLILPQAVLDLPRIAPINVHASLLPRYRGAAPIQRAIMDECEQTGVSIMRMEAGLDTGPVYAARAVEIGEHSSGSLHELLAETGGDALAELLARPDFDGSGAVPQHEAGASYAPRLTREDERVDWNLPARTAHARIRALTPWPGARGCVELPGRAPGEGPREIALSFAPGRIGEARPEVLPVGALCRDTTGALCIACRDALYVVSAVKPAGRAFMAAGDFLRGFAVPGQGAVLGRMVSISREACGLSG